MSEGLLGRVEDEGRAGCRWEIEVGKVRIITIMGRQSQQASGAQVDRDVCEQDVRFCLSVFVYALSLVCVCTET